MSSIAQIRSEIERRIPGAFTVYEPSSRSAVRTGIPAVDLYGILKGGLTQICASGPSSGNTRLLISLIALLTGHEHYCAVVDSEDSFDPEGAALAGAELNRLLWVRCQPKAGHQKRLTPLEQAFKAADLLVQNSGFDLIAVDLASISESDIRKVPLTTWFRFARVAEKTGRALVFFLSYPAGRSCATLTLHMSGNGGVWNNSAATAGPSHTRVLTSVDFRFDSQRGRIRKPVQPDRLA
jgi:hypothetical protein